MAKRVKAPAIPVPQTREDFEKLAVELGEAMRSVERVGSKLADDTARLKLAAKLEAEPIGDRAKALWTLIAGYAEAHRTELLPKDRKSLAIAAGVIGWRNKNPAVVLDGEEEDLVAALEAASFDDYLRSYTAIDKAAILADPKRALTIPGITISRGEELFFKPLDVDAERKKTVAPSGKAA